METQNYKTLLLQTALCCMAIDGEIAESEIETIEKFCKQSPLLAGVDVKEQIRIFVSKINEQGKQYVSDYLKTLAESAFSQKEELDLLDFAIQVIVADNRIDYEEVKLFKQIRKRVKVSNEVIVEKFPDVEYWLEDDINAPSFELPQLGNFDITNILN